MLQESRHLTQRIVAGEMPVAVVDTLEMIQIDHENSQDRAVSAGAVQLRCQPKCQRAPIEDLGQWVGVRQRLETRVVSPGRLNDLRPLNRGHRGPDDRVGELDIFCGERRLITGSA